VLITILSKSLFLVVLIESNIKFNNLSNPYLSIIFVSLANTGINLVSGNKFFICFRIFSTIGFFWALEKTIIKGILLQLFFNPFKAFISF
jgi:uncharacterized membrane protein YjjP (DUF1212 family)